MIIHTHFRDLEEFDTDERCSIIELSNSDQDAACSIAQARVRPNVSTANHKLMGIEERYVILQGSGLAKVDGEPFLMNRGDTLVIPAGCEQSIQNLNENEDLIFLCICTPRFEPEAYINLETGSLGQIRSTLDK